MKIKRRFPNYFSGFEETEHEVYSLNDLLELPWIKEYSKSPDFIGLYYSKKTYDDSPDYLMALWYNKEEGKDIIYFVVGYIFGDGESLGLEDYINYI